MTGQPKPLTFSVLERERAGYQAPVVASVSGKGPSFSLPPLQPARHRAVTARPRRSELPQQGPPTAVSMPASVQQPQGGSAHPPRFSSALPAHGLMMRGTSARTR
jgi:hypothetical protein